MSSDFQKDIIGEDGKYISSKGTMLISEMDKHHRLNAAGKLRKMLEAGVYAKYKDEVEAKIIELESKEGAGES